MVEHTQFKCGYEGHCYDPTGDRGCMICDGGLSLCVVCGGAEAELPTHCPGVSMPRYAREEVLRGSLDFRDGAWHRIKPALRLGDVE